MKIEMGKKPVVKIDGITDSLTGGAIVCDSAKSAAQAIFHNVLDMLWGATHGESVTLTIRFDHMDIAEFQKLEPYE